METNVTPQNMDTTLTGCCPRFDPSGWDGRHLTFKEQPFVRATTRSLFHVLINMGAVFTRVQINIEDADAREPEHYLVLSRDLSATEAEHLFMVTGDVPGKDMVRLSGAFITRVFEGPYRQAKNWMHEMETAAEAAGHTTKRIFMFYTTCPKCARVYGKNYVVGVAEI